MEELIARFDAVVPVQWEPHELPTEKSVAYIGAHFRFAIPASLLAFAYSSKSFSSFFLSLGPDYGNHAHVIAKNELIRTDPYWQELGKGHAGPPNLVLFTDNFMSDFLWGFDINRTGPEYPVVCWPSDRSIANPPHSYPSFASFITAQIIYYEKARTRRA